MLPKYLLLYLHSMTIKEEHPCFTDRECSDKKIEVGGTALLNPLIWSVALLGLDDIQQDSRRLQFRHRSWDLFDQRWSPSNQKRTHSFDSRVPVMHRMMQGMMYRKDLLLSAPKMRKVSSETTSEKSALAFWANRGKSWFPAPAFGTIFVLRCKR